MPNTTVAQTIDSFLQEVNAGVKQAEANTEAGGYAGGTTHPVKDEDDRTQAATEGSRSSENTADNKSEPNRGDATVDNNSEASTSTQSGNANQDSVQYNIGTQQAATGEDSSSETSSVKADKDDDGYKEKSKHPARTDNDQLDGHKYAVELEGMSFAQLGGLLKESGDNLVALIADSAHKTANGDMPYDKEDEDEDEDKEKDAALAAQAGSEVASLFTPSGAFNPKATKEGADREVHGFLVGVIKEAEDDAIRTALYLDQYKASKVAMGPEEMMAGGEQPLEEAMMAGGDPGEAGGATGGGDEAAMMEALSGGGEGGEIDPLAAAGGEDPLAAGEDPLGGGGGEEAAMGGESEEIALLQQILELLGANQGEMKAATALAGRPAPATTAAVKYDAPLRAKAAAAIIQNPGNTKFAEMTNYVVELLERSRR